MVDNRSWFIGLILLSLFPLAINSEARFQPSTPILRDYWPTTGWRSVLPEVQGMNSTFLHDFWDHIHTTAGVEAFLLIRNGYLLFEEYGPSSSMSYLWRIYSATKSVTAIATGLALTAGFISHINDSVLDYFQDRVIQNPDPRKTNMTLWHLLTMSSGLERSDFGLGTQPDWVQYLLDSPMAHEPGEVWSYNGGCSHLLSAIISETTGLSMETLVRNRLFTPMGISVYDWGVDPQGVSTGMAGLSLTLRDLAKLGYLYLNNGTWGTAELIPSEWVAECTQPYFIFPYGEGYGYQWWIDLPITGYSMRGAGGMRVFVLPDQDLVLVFGAAPYGSEAYYALFDEYINPAIIGDPQSLLTPTSEQLLLVIVGGLSIAIFIATMVVYRRRKIQ
ncbi:MAG: serine hydrolase domain-containing protein [Candidatus Thorarchaeota archaeon]